MRRCQLVMYQRSPPAPKKMLVDCGTAADDDVTPANLVSVRSYLSKKRRENRKSMSKEERKCHATVLNGLSSRPKNQTHVKELNEINDLLTPERAEELLALAEDMEEDQEDVDYIIQFVHTT